MKDTNPNAHIKVFKKAITTNSEIMETDITNLFGFTLQDNMSKDHPNYTFDELEQTFCDALPSSWIDSNVSLK